MHRFLARLFRKHQRRAARSDYRKPYQARLTVERLEERALMALVVPAYHSLPSATAKLYLDFDGNYESSWQQQPGSAMKPFTNITTPAFDLDGNPTDFNPDELVAIRKICERVAEDYAPFNIDVTTVNPGSFNDKQALHVVIGGSAYDWYWTRTPTTIEARDGTSGTSSPGSFSDGWSNNNVVYVFSGTIREMANTPWYDVKASLGLGSGVTEVLKYGTDGDGRREQFIPMVANTVSHEAGHAFGLRHQTGFKFDGSATEYSAGGTDWTPIMGDNLTSDRTKWWNGKAPNGLVQDDMAVIANTATNGFGYRTDELDLRPFAVQPSNSWYTSHQASTGVIATTADKDAYYFTSAGGLTQISVIVAAEGANLDATLQVFRVSPSFEMVAYVDATPTATDQGLNAIYSASLSPGLYYVIVGSHGTYGDVGQYAVAVTTWSNQISSIPPQLVYQPVTPGYGLQLVYQPATPYVQTSTIGSVSNWANGASNQATAAPHSTARTAALPAARGETSLDDHTRALLAWTAQRGHLPLDAAFARLSAHSSHRLGQE